MTKASAICISKKEIASGVVEVLLELPESFNFIPGQFISVLVNTDSNAHRAYSIASLKSPTKQIKLVVSLKPGGVGSKYYENLKVGDQVTFIGPAGSFILPETLPKALNFVATGTGMVAFLPMLQELMRKNYAGKITLLAGFRYAKDIFYEKLLQKFEEDLKNFNYFCCLSQEKPVDSSSRARRYSRVTENLDLLKFPDALFYLSGNPHMVPEVKEKLLTKGIKENQIYAEKY